ncbi:alginate lyase family protein [Pedobacter duraquae]|uniref:Alginate lyase n=1 Tax=Pedobacter duraquae TaxID=425511 RepID=A0A4R6IQX3_9SPHI|nr:alginate lyase family protein [Pedobacter duraquae]TDO24772.1 alginate lyase [Pedobacter duraquae]
MIKRLIILVILCLSGAFSTYAQTGLTAKQLRNLKIMIKSNAEVQLLFTSILKNANQALVTPPNPIDTISTEGRLKGDPIKIKTGKALPDLQKIYDLALTYRVKGDKKYLNRAILYLEAWAQINRSKGDPIDDTHLDAAIAGYVLIKEQLNPTSKNKVDAWLKQVADAEIYVLQKFPRKETTYNNWNSHRLKVIAEVAFAIDDPALQDFSIEALKAQLTRNLNPDGTSIDFLKRDALHYHTYDLEPLLRLAILIKEQRKLDFYTYTTPGGSSIKNSMEWLVPYLSGEKTHEEFVKSTVKFDLERAKNGEADYVAGTLFKPVAGLKTLALAYYFDQRYLQLIQKINNNTIRYSDWQLVLNDLYLGR